MTIHLFAELIDALKSGGDVRVKNSKLAIIMEVKNRFLRGYFPYLGSSEIIFHTWASQRQHLKMSNQILVISTMIRVVGSLLLYTYKIGTNLNKEIDVIGKGAASPRSEKNIEIRIAKEGFQSQGWDIKKTAHRGRIMLWKNCLPLNKLIKIIQSEILTQKPLYIK